MPGCLVRRRTLPAVGVRQNLPLLTASKEELIQRVHNASDPIQAFLMRADLSPSVTGGPDKQAATDYATLSSYILFRRPDQLRVIGQDPVLETTIFDMVSSNNEFRLSLPRKKRFVVGTNSAPVASKNKLENLRPTALLTALIVSPPDPAAESVLLEDDTSATRAVYILLIIRSSHDQLSLARSIYFDHYTLEIVRQRIFDSSGRIRSETRYSNWTSYNGIRYPSEIDIQRPQDNYEVQLSVLSMRINTPDITAEKFVLNQPPGSELQQLK